MPSRRPPLLQSGVGDEIAHGSLDLAPRRCAKDAIAVREVHCLKVLKEPIEKGAESEFRNRIEILKRMQPAQKNGTEFAAVVEGLCEFSPLNGQRVHRGLSPLLGLLPDLYREIDQRRNPDADRCQLAYRCQHFPVHSINNSASE